MTNRPWRRKLMAAGVIALAAVTVTLFQNCADGLPDTAIGSSLTSRPYGSIPAFPGTSCKQILASNPRTQSGVFYLDPDGVGNGLDTFQAYCDMTTDGGGWMLAARNNQTTTFTNFDKPWADYKAGFGNVLDPNSLGWLGLDRLHEMTASGTEVRVVNNVRTHYYSGFKVDSEANNYKLTVVNTTSSLDNGSFAGHSGSNFSTSDRDNDSYAGNCATTYKTGWWFASCFNVSLAANESGVAYWRDPGGAVENATFIEMWVR